MRPGPSQNPHRHEPLRSALGRGVPLLELIAAQKSLRLEGVMTHFAQSDEADKSFALLQISRFDEVMGAWRRAGARRCRASIFATAAAFWICRRPIATWCGWGFCCTAFSPRRFAGAFAGIQPVMSVKARIAAIQHLKPGEVVGYGMRYTAPVAAPHRRAAHRLRRRLPARAQRGRRAHPRAARAAGGRRGDGRHYGGHHRHSRGANVG